MQAALHSRTHVNKQEKKCRSCVFTYSEEVISAFCKWEKDLEGPASSILKQMKKVNEGGK